MQLIVHQAKDWQNQVRYCRTVSSAESFPATSTQSKGQKSITIPKTRSPSQSRASLENATFIGIPATPRPSTVGGAVAAQRELLRLPDKLWLPIVALHVFALGYLATSIYGLVLLVSGALKEGVEVKLYVLLSLTAIPAMWVLTWANYTVISFLKRGHPKAYYFAWSLICIWFVLPFFSMPKLGVLGLIPVALGYILAGVGVYGLLHAETKQHCKVSEATPE
jgi:hypothetical protein